MLDLIKKHRFGLVVSAIFLAISLCVLVVPWKSLIEDRIKQLLSQQGLQNVGLQLTQIGFHHLTVKGIVWQSADEQTPTPKLDELVLDYTPLDLLWGRLGALQLAGMDVVARSNDRGWSVSGLDLASEQQPSATSWPLSPEELLRFPLARLQLSHGQVEVKTPVWQARFMAEGSWRKEPTPQITFNTNNLSFKTADVTVETGDVAGSVELNPDKKVLEGPWTAMDIKVGGANADIPVLSGRGALYAKADTLALDGTLESLDSATQAKFRLAYSAINPAQSILRIDSVVFPWQGGRVSAHDIAVPLQSSHDVTVLVRLQHVSLTALLEKLTGARASGTGDISGALPVTIQADGNVVLHQGVLSAQGPGVIHMAPDVIPGDNAQVAFVRDVLKNLNYTQLSIEVESDAQRGMRVVLKVAGHNPEVASGRPVQLNVNLTGDVLDFVRQNFVLFTDPRKYLEQNSHAKP